MDKDQDYNGVGPAIEMLVKANKFLHSLHAAQKDVTLDNEFALFPFAHKNRKTFDYLAPSSPFIRRLPSRYMNSNQQLAAIDLDFCLLTKQYSKLN